MSLKFRKRLRSALSGRVAGILLAGIVLVELGMLAQSVAPGGERLLSSVLPGALAALSNDARAAAGLSPLREDGDLSRAAALKAADMASRGYFAHRTPEGEEPWVFLERVGYEYGYAGENLALNFADSKEVTAAWLASPTHRANLLSGDFSRVGFGVATGTYEGREALFVVQFLASPKEREPSSVALPPSASENLRMAPPEAPRVEGYVSGSPASLFERVFGRLSGPAALVLLAGMALLLAFALILKLRRVPRSGREVWSNALLGASALAGLLLLFGGALPNEARLPETAASVRMSVR